MSFGPSKANYLGLQSYPLSDNKSNYREFKSGKKIKSILKSFPLVVEKSARGDHSNNTRKFNISSENANNNNQSLPKKANKIEKMRSHSPEIERTLRYQKDSRSPKNHKKVAERKIEQNLSIHQTPKNIILSKHVLPELERGFEVKNKFQVNPHLRIKERMNETENTHNRALESNYSENGAWLDSKFTDKRYRELLAIKPEIRENISSQRKSGVNVFSTANSGKKINDFILIGKIKNMDFPKSAQKKPHNYVKTRMKENHEKFRYDYNDTLQTSMESLENPEHLEESPSRPMVKMLLERTHNGRILTKFTYNNEHDKDFQGNDYSCPFEEKASNLGTISEVKNRLKKNYNFSKYYHSATKGIHQHHGSKHNNNFNKDNYNSSEEDRSKTSSSQYEEHGLGNYQEKNRRVHQSYLEGHSLNQDINSNSFESKYSSHKKIHVSKNHGDFRLSLTKKSKNNLRYGQKNMIHSTPRKSQINLLKKVNSMGDNFTKSNFKSLKTLQGKLQSDTNLGSLSKSQAIENSFISNHRVKAERARKIFLRNNQSIKRIKMKENYVQPHISNKSLRSLVEMDIGKKKSEQSSLPQLRRINNDSEMKEMILKLSYSLVKMKNSHNSTKFNSRKRNISILKKVIRTKNSQLPSGFKDYSTNLGNSYDFSRNLSSDKVAQTKSRSEDIISYGDNMISSEPSDQFLHNTGGKSSVQKALKYFISQKMKGNHPIDYTKYFWINNDKYISKFTPL
ncbi:unnamed protein product [Moneuplotes crassus]|uniref:Uncharacterized protein n=1 Tax=Euplotes crassus TaxID=5936 RepID=A0AAD1Y9P8_EUPCR|nr:unnamed protein product [Moneuplotes crassus]